MIVHSRFFAFGKKRLAKGFSCFVVVCHINDVMVHILTGPFLEWWSFDASYNITEDVVASALQNL